jgi:hypothetical protein
MRSDRLLQIVEDTLVPIDLVNFDFRYFTVFFGQNCGTKACAIGHHMLARGDSIPLRPLNNVGGNPTILHQGRVLLDCLAIAAYLSIPENDAVRLFIPGKLSSDSSCRRVCIGVMRYLKTHDPVFYKQHRATRNAKRFPVEVAIEEQELAYAL